MNDERSVLPDAKEAPLIVDVEFTETDEVAGSPILDSVERVETEKASGPMELPPSVPTPEEEEE